ncbi:hypothetical protein [Streptomyces sp. NBC_01794]|uniref:hypothetical protein n=1 Tax=Streptomyces sp. NBC_01794 TaxID=2975942 RepID=UPI00308EFD34|nr:hypothetical protein OIE54_06915 [Streptomyces sp. NBC_01794]
MTRACGGRQEFRRAAMSAADRRAGFRAARIRLPGGVSLDSRWATWIGITDSGMSTAATTCLLGGGHAGLAVDVACAHGIRPGGAVRMLAVRTLVVARVRTTFPAVAAAPAPR